MGKITSEEKLRREMKKVLKERGTVLFIGSGISTWSGLPTWGRLMEDMAEYIDKKGISSDEIRKYAYTEPLMAADFGCDRLTSEEFEEFIKSSCKYKVAKPHMIHNLIVNLDPTCYITTNYDDLLEQTLKKKGLMKKYNIVTNNDPNKCGSLIQLKSDHFIFKPHGDLSKPGSIILSGNQYSDLYNNGTKYCTYRSLETLLLTRNIIFIGFGLKDPDFLNIMVKIRNEYSGNPITHYAIMADVSESEQVYWDKNYGIKILSYKKNKNSQGTTSHNQLLSILESLVNKNNRNKPTIEEKREDFRVTKKHKTSLAKYANYVLQKSKIPDGPIFPLLINGKSYYRSYEGRRVSEFIKINQGSFIITGNPGSGKTYFLKQYSSYMAKQLFEWTQGSSMKGMPKIPIFIDLRDYKGKGSLAELISNQFPDEVPIQNLLNENRICLLLDGFNEIDESEQRFCKKEIMTYGYRNDIVIATRFSEALDSHSKEYILENIEPEFIIDYIQQMGIEVPEEIREDFIGIFKNPLLFYLFASNKIVIDSQISIDRIFESYLENLYKECYKDFGIELDFKKIFSEFSYNRFQNGKEIFNIEEIEALFALKLPNIDFNLRKDIINNLIDKYRFLVPGSYNGVSFFHQQITEYFVAFHFSILYKTNPTILSDIIIYKNWDYILGLASTFFGKGMEDVYFSKILERDLLLAIKCVTYMNGENKHIAITKILELLIKKIDKFEFNYILEIEHIFNQIEFDIGHETLLRELKNYQDIIGGVAAAGLLKIFNGNQQIKNELINELFKEEVITDYNYISRLGRLLSEYITIDEFRNLIERVVELEFDEEECLSMCIGKMAIHLKFSEVISVFNKMNSLNDMQRNILADILRDRDENETFDLCIQLLEEGWNEILFPLYMQVKYKGENINLKNYEMVFQRLIQFIEEENRCAIELMYELYQRSIPFAKLVRSQLKYADGILKLVFFYCIGKNRRDSFFSLYNSLLYFNHLPIDLIDAFSEEDWTENADHIICYLSEKGRMEELEKFCNCVLSSTKTRFYKINLKAILSILNLVKNLLGTNNFELYRIGEIGEFLAKYIHKYELLRLYRIISQDIRCFFHLYVLNRVEGFSLEDFIDSDIEQILIELQTHQIIYEDEILLSNIASEGLIRKRLIPLLESDNKILSSNIRTILYKLGEINQIRYI